MKLMDGVETRMAEALAEEQDPEARASIKAQLELWQTARQITERHEGEPQCGLNYVFDGLSALNGLILFLAEPRHFAGPIQPLARPIRCAPQWRCASAALPCERLATIEEPTP